VGLKASIRKAGAPCLFRLVNKINSLHYPFIRVRCMALVPGRKMDDWWNWLREWIVFPHYCIQFQSRSSNQTQLLKLECMYSLGFWMLEFGSLCCSLLIIITLQSTKSSIFWDITPCSPLKLNRRFGGTCCFHLQCRRISQARNQREGSDPEDQSNMFLRNVGWFSTDYAAYIPEDRILHNHRCENLKLTLKHSG
jgi:hypothetical protein